MKYLLIATLFFLSAITAKASDKDSTIIYNLPDSVKAIQFMAEIKVQSVKGKKEVYAGIKTDKVKLYFEADKDEREIVFEFPASAKVVSTGLQVDTDEKGEIEFDYNWSINETYKLLIAVALDSAENYSLYSGYVWLPKENNWKLIGTCKITGQWNTIQAPATFFTKNKKKTIQVSIGEVWCQRNRGAWWNLKKEVRPNPVIKLAGHLDSAQQRQTEIKLMEEAIATGKTDMIKNKDNVYYTILKEGDGKQIVLSDSVTVFYKGYLFSDGTVFDQTAKKPITFPLNRLIKGWQIALPLCKVGGKIKLAILSDMAYSIRTTSSKIPPNSILVFEIEVVDAKSTN